MAYAALEDFEDLRDLINDELPARAILLTPALTGYDGDPNDGGAPDILKNAPVGVQYLQETPGPMRWIKLVVGTAWAVADVNIGAPVSSTDNALVRWDGTTASAIKDSNVTLSNSDAMVFPSEGSISKPGTGSSSEAFGLSAVASDSSATALGNSASASGQNTVALGTNAVASANQSVCCGSGAIASALESVAIGTAQVYPVASGDSIGSIAIGNAEIGDSTPDVGCGASIAIGNYATILSGSEDSIAIGYFSRAGIGGNCTVVGTQARAFANQAISLGYHSRVYDVSSGDNEGAIAIGSNSEIGSSPAGAGCQAAIAIGEGASVGAGSTNAVCVGPNANIGLADVESVAIGYNAASTQQQGIAIGSSASAGYESLALGKGTVSGAWSIAIGSGASVNPSASYCTVLGYNASAAATSCDNDVILGANATVAIGGNTVCIGASTNIYDTLSGFANGAVLIGYLASIGDSTPGAPCDGAICIGRAASVKPGASDCVVIGKDAISNAAQALVMGEAAKVHPVSSGDSTGAIAVGSGATVGSAAAAGAEAAIAIGEGASVAAGAINSIAIGPGAVCRQYQSVMIGQNAQNFVPTSGDNYASISIGYNSKVGDSAKSGSDAGIAIGMNAFVDGNCRDSIAIGHQAKVTDGISNGTYSVALGYNAVIENGYGSNAIGFGSRIWATNCIGLGTYAKIFNPSTSDNEGSIAIGKSAEIGANAQPGCEASIAIGEGASISAGAVNSVAVGERSSVTSRYGTAVGSVAQVTTGAGVAVGLAAKSFGDGGIAIGSNSDVGSDITNGIGIGAFADCYAINGIVIGAGAGVYPVSSGDSFGAIALGRQARVGNSTPGAGCQAAIAIGKSARVGVGHTNAVAIGAGAASSASNRVTFASALEVEIGQGLAVWGVTPPGSQPSKVNDPSGGTTVDTEARSAIAAIIDALEGCGITSAT